jgi:hypothetical protein
MRNIFKHLKIAFSDVKVLFKKGAYKELERAIVDVICIRLKIEPLVFDRIPYQHYKQIVRSDYDQLKLRFS